MISTVCNVEIEVHRVILFPIEARLYTEDEMPVNQALLLEHARYQDLAEVDEILIFPSMPAAPSQIEQTISYQIEFQARVTPD